MADIKDKEYSLLKENLENFGKGAKKHKGDTKDPLPPNIIQKRYDDAETTLTDSWDKAKDLETETKKAFADYQKDFKNVEGLYNKDVRTIKGIYGILNKTLRDYGVQPEKKRKGRKPKPRLPKP